MRRLGFHVHRESRELIRVPLLKQPADPQRSGFFDLFELEPASSLPESQHAVHFAIAPVFEVRENFFNLPPVAAVQGRKPCGELLFSRRLRFINYSRPATRKIAKTARYAPSPNRHLHGPFLPQKLP